MDRFKKLVAEVDESGDKDKMAMFADALPKQQKMLMDSGLLIIPFFRQQTWPLLKPVEQSSLNYFASAWCALENMLLAATNEGLGAVFHIPVSNEAEQIKKIVHAPEGYEFICLLEKPRDFDPFGQTGFAHLWLQYDCPFKVLVLGVNFILPF